MRARMTSFKTRTILLTGMVVAGLLGNRSVNAVASSSGTFTLTGSLNTARRDHTATLLQNGEVLVAGGTDVNNNLTTALASAELYNPTTGKWTLTGSMSDARTAFTATLLANGEVLVAGGSNEVDCLDRAEL